MDTIYVEHLPAEVTEEGLRDFFGQIGVLRTDNKTHRPKIWIYRDPSTGLPKGDATVSYEDPYAASSAVQWFNQTPFKGGGIIGVSLAKDTDASFTSFATDPATDQFTQNAMSQASNLYPDNRGQWHKNVEGSRGRGRKIVAAPQGPQRLFGPDDWPCPSCGNTNWARRPRCNLCGAPKPGTSDMKREGQGGGFKELDQDELVEDRRRRKAFEEADDGELYDDYGRIKKKYRSIVDKTTREEAALSRLRGHYDPSPSGQELASLFKNQEEADVQDIKNEKALVDPSSSSTELKKSTRDRSRSLSPEERSRPRSKRTESPSRSRQGRHRSRGEDFIRSKH